MPTLNFPTNPTLNQTYSFGGKTWVWNGQGWQLSASGAINNIPIGNITPASGAFTTLSANTFTANGITVLGNITGANLNATGNLSIAGNVNSPLNVRANVTATNFVTAGTLTAGIVSATGNVTGAYIIGDGSQLTNLPGVNYSNANVAAYLPTYTGNLPNLTGPVTTTGNLTGNNIVVSGLITATGNVTGGNLRTAGSISAAGNITGGNVATGNILAGNVSTAGNVSGTYILGDGSQLTNLPAGNYSNANVANYLPTYTGNLASLTGPVTTTANITGSNLVTAGSITATGNIAGGNIATGNLIAANVASLGTVSAVGNVAGTYFIGNGAFLTGIATGNNDYSNANVAAYLPTYSGNLVSLTGPVITTGNITGGNVSTAGNVTANNLIANSRIKIGLANIYTTNFDPAVLRIQSEVVEFSGQIIAISDISGNNISAGGNVTGSNIRTAGYVSATGNMYAANFVGNVAGNITVPGANTQILFNDGGLAGANTGLTFNKITQVLSVTGNIQGGNLRTAGLITATGNIAGQYFVGNGALLTGIIATAGAAITNGSSNVTVAGNGNVTVTVTGNYNVTTFATTGVYTTGLVSATGNVAGNYLLGNGALITGLPVGYSNADVATYLPTYSGNLPSLTGLVSTTGNISGNYVLGNGALLTGVITSVANINNGTSNITVVSSGGNITVGVGGTGNVAVFATTGEYVTGVVSASGNITGSNLVTSGLASITGNVDAGNVRTAGLVSATGNITSGNVLTGGLISATGNVTGGNITTAGTITATGNVQAGNLVTAGSITATGNISAAYFSGNGAGLSNVIASGGVGNTITLGTPTDGNLVANGAYQGWTTATFVTDGLDDLNQVAFNIANSTYVGNTYITANVYSGPSPLSVSFTGLYIGNPNSYLWQFGDGTANATTANAIHTFSNALGGTFTVSFTAFNTNGTFNGNAANGAKGSTSTASISNIVLYTPSPIPSFTLSSNSFNSGNSVTVTNTSQYVTWYDLSFGDGTANFTAGPGLGNTSFTTVNHTYNSVAANTDSLYSVILSGTSNTAGASNVTVVSSASNVKSFSSQASNVVVTANVITVINGLGVVSFRNDSNGAPGNTASFGSQQLYNYNYGDGNVSNVNVGTGIAGNPSAANVTNTFVLSGANQAANAYQQFTANLFLYTGFSSSPAKSSNITITVNPQVRANFIGATANTTTDATANTGNARVGYIYTDYTGNDRATFTFQNTSQNSNLANWSWGDSTFSNGVSNVGNTLHTYTSTGAKTVALTANGTPNGISSTAQSNTSSITGYIFIATNPTAPTNLSGFSNLAIANTSEGTSPLLAAGARDATGGNIVANGASVTRFAATTTIATAANIVNANTATTGTLSAYVNNNISGNVTFTTNGNTVGSNAALVISADRDLHVANAAVPSYFYKVFNANISCALSSLGTGYNNYKLVHTVSGNTNYVGFVKDNLNTAPSLVTSNIAIVEGTAGTYRYISGIPYYNTGSPTVTIANLAVANLSGQTFRSTDPFVLASGTVSEGTGALVSATQTKSLSTINNSGSSFLTSANLNANIGIASNYTLGNMTANLTGANNVVATLQANIFNVIGTSATVQLPANIQMYAGANSGVNEQSITASTTGNTQAAIRVVMSTAGNTPVFSNSTNFYTANAWSGAQTIAGTPEAVVRYGVLKQYAVDLSTGYLPVGPNLSVAGGRTSTQYFTFAFARPSLANFDIRITSATGVAGVWIAAPGTTIDKSGFTSPTPGFPGPTSTINGWLEASTQYAGSGVPGASSTGGNGSNGCALTGADVIPLNTAISNVAYTMTLGSQNAANSTGTNILIRIALASGQTISDLQIGTAT